MSKAKRATKLEDPEVLEATDDIRRQTRDTVHTIREAGRTAAAANKRLRQAQRERDMLERGDEDDDYSDAIRLGYVWAVIVVGVAAAILMHANGVFSG